MSDDIGRNEKCNLRRKNNKITMKYFVDKSKVLPDIDFAKMRFESFPWHNNLSRHAIFCSYITLQQNSDIFQDEKLCFQLIA